MGYSSKNQVIRNYWIWWEGKGSEQPSQTAALLVLKAKPSFEQQPKSVVINVYLASVIWPAVA